MMKRLCFALLVLAACVSCVTLTQAEFLSEATPADLVPLKSEKSLDSTHDNVDHDSAKINDLSKDDDEEEDDEEDEVNDAKSDDKAASDLKSNEDDEDMGNAATSMLGTKSQVTANLQANDAANAAAASAPQVAPQAMPISGAAPQLPLWYVTTMLGQAALSGGMGGIGRKTSAAPARGGKSSPNSNVRSNLTPMAPEMYHTALLATHLAVTHRAFHAGTIPTGLDAFERKSAEQEKAFKDFQRQQQMMSAYGQPMMGMNPMMMQHPMPYGGYPMMPPQQPMMGQMPQGYNPYMMQQQQQQPYNPYMQQQQQFNPYMQQMMQQPMQQQQQPLQMKQSVKAASKSASGAKSTADKIVLSGNKIRGLKSSLISEIEAAHGKKDY